MITVCDLRYGEGGGVYEVEGVKSISSPNSRSSSSSLIPLLSTFSSTFAGNFGHLSRTIKDSRLGSFSIERLT